MDLDRPEESGVDRCICMGQRILEETQVSDLLPSLHIKHLYAQSSPTFACMGKVS